MCEGLKVSIFYYKNLTRKCFSISAVDMSYEGSQATYVCTFLSYLVDHGIIASIVDDRFATDLFFHESLQRI